MVLLKITETLVSIRGSITSTTAIALRHLHFHFDQKSSLERVHSLSVFLSYGASYYSEVNNDSYLIVAGQMLTNVLAVP